MSKLSYGSYTDIKLSDGYLTKKINISALGDVQKLVLKNTQSSIHDILEYQKLLMEDDFPIEKAFDIVAENNIVEYKQKYIKSKNLDELLEEYFNDKNFNHIMKIFDDVISLWIKSHKSSNYYVDYNLRNFVYKHNKLVLIDLFPPLIAKNIKSTSNKDCNSQIQLWTNKYVNLASLICYFVQSGVSKDIKVDDKIFLDKILDNIFEIINKQLNIDKQTFILEVLKIKHIFAKRFENLIKIYNNQDKVDDFLNVKLF